MDGEDIVKVVEGEPTPVDPLDIWVLDDPARNGHGEIVCLRENTSGDDSLTHYAIDGEMFKGKCDEYIMGYCYEVLKDEKGNVIQSSCYPYKDWDTLNTIQRLWEQKTEAQNHLSTSTETMIDLDYRQTMMDLGLTP